MFPTDYWQVIFNPSVFVRVPHMVLASYLIVAFVVGAVGAWHLLRGARHASGRARCSPWRCGWRRSWRRCRSCMGDMHGLNTLEHQPAKIAAMEGDWEPSGPTARR